jgi:hypothetical protein
LRPATARRARLNWGVQLDSADIVPGQRTDPADRSAAAYPDRSTMDRGGTAETLQATLDDDVCARMSGTRPRGRQARMLEYYYQREHICAGPAAGVPTLLLARNPYRTQLWISCYAAAGTFDQFNLAHSQADLTGNHFTVSGFLYTFAAGFASNFFSQILSFPIHGPIVGEEWWGRSAGGFVSFDLTGYLYSD